VVVAVRVSIEFIMHVFVSSAIVVALIDAHIAILL